MKDFNIRSPDLWRIISNNVDFKGKRVIDIGCGHGDLAWRTVKAGADLLAIDSDPEALKDCRKRMLFHKQEPCLLGVYFEEYLPYITRPFDIAICLSVLPYLTWNYDKSLAVLSETVAPALIIELQYFGDGPGKEEIVNDADMRELLENYYENVMWIGSTGVKKGQYMRSIWKCE